MVLVQRQVLAQDADKRWFESGDDYKGDPHQHASQGFQHSGSIIMCVRCEWTHQAPPRDRRRVVRVQHGPG